MRIHHVKAHAQSYSGVETRKNQSKRRLFSVGIYRMGKTHRHLWDVRGTDKAYCQHKEAEKDSKQKSETYKPKGKGGKEEK